jgi:acetyl-CoA acyltransferase 1
MTSGCIDIELAMGAESMTHGTDRAPKPFHSEILTIPEAADCMQPMIQASENVRSWSDISRNKQDEYACESFCRAEETQKSGLFDDEIVKKRTSVKDKDGDSKEIELSVDEGPRYGTTLEGLSKLKPARPDFGDKATGDNASQITDGDKYREI